MYSYLWYFVIFSFLGWCMEVVYHTVSCGSFANRGFLNGPVCPIYGVGAALLIAFLYPFAENLFLLYLFSVFITSLLELLTGYVLEKVFNMKWWDYSHIPFNIGGYVCLKFSLCWGMAGVFLMRVMLPFFDKIITRLPYSIGCFLLCLIGICYTADAVFTVIVLRSLKQRFKIAEKISLKLRVISDELGIHISDSVFDVMDRVDDVTKSGKLKLDEFEDLKKQYKDKISNINFSQKRIIRAFPGLKSEHYRHMLEQVKNNIDKKK